MDIDKIKQVMDDTFDPSISSRVKDSLKRRSEERQKLLSQKIPYGYDMVDGELVVNELESEVVKWISKTTMAYLEHPPACLVNATIEKYRIFYNEELTYEEAEQKVLYSQILEYVTKEINCRYRLFENISPDKAVDSLKAILALAYDDVKDRLADTAPDETLSTWARRVRRVHNNPVYSGTLHMHMKHTDAKKSLTEDTYGIVNHHEPLVSQELFEAVQKKKYGTQTLDEQKNQARQRALDMGFAVLGDNEVVDAGGALCETCGQRKLIVDGCSCHTVECNGKRYERIRYGEESIEWNDNCCHDCGARPGHFHHPGCDVEECPVCGEQLISCGCDIEFVTED